MNDPGPPSPERRQSPRQRPRGKVRVTVHAGLPSPNLARALLDVSATGLRILLKQAVELGAELVVTVQRLNHQPPLHRVAVVRWAVDREDGSCIVGVELNEPLDGDALNRLCGGK